MCNLGTDRCWTHGGRLINGKCPTGLALAEVWAERAEQFRKYGTNENLADGTGRNWVAPGKWRFNAEGIERGFRKDYERHEREVGRVTWMHLVREEVAEAFAETDPKRLREELIQVAALAVSWIEKLDTRA